MIKRFLGWLLSCVLLCLPLLAHAAYRAGSVTYTSNGNQSATTLTVNSPVGVQSGDIVLLMVTMTGNGATSYGFASSSGFTEEAENYNSTTIHYGPNGSVVTLLWKVATASEPSTYTVTVATSAPYVPVTAICAAWSGRSATPFTVTPVLTAATGGGGSGGNVNYTLTGLTANAGDDLIFWPVVNPQGTASTPSAITAPSGFTSGVFNVNSSYAYPTTYFAYENDVSAGATGNPYAVVDLDAIEDGTDYIGYVISLGQASAAGTSLQGGFALSPSN